MINKPKLPINKAKSSSCTKTKINPPHLSIGSRLPNEHLPPLGLLSIGGPLIDEGYEVRKKRYLLRTIKQF